MNKAQHILGMMSGTSMDGVDAARLSINWQEGKPRLVALGAHHYGGFDAEFRDQIREVLGRVEPDQDTQEVTKGLMAKHLEVVQGFQEKYPEETLDALGIHGQTITHFPKHHFSWQLADAHWLAKQAQLPVLHDFRAADLQNGGEGAPLAPVFHEALCAAGFLPAPPFGVLNIGGVSNISLIGEDNDLIAFDCGPGNGPMDDYCQEVLSIPYDQDGMIAKDGVVHAELISEYLAHPYFLLDAPKSLDRRDFGFEPLLGIPAADALMSLCSISAAAIALSIQKYHERIPIKQLAVAGGGRKNKTLMEALVRLVPHIEVKPIEDFHAQLSGDAIEAWAFAWLAALHLADMPASFPSTTGCRQPTLAGKVALPEGG